MLDFSLLWQKQLIGGKIYSGLWFQSMVKQFSLFLGPCMVKDNIKMESMYVDSEIEMDQDKV
jgi:hypothetical protein